MSKNKTIENLALFGGNKLFTAPKSIRKPGLPDVEKYLGYSRTFIERRHYTNNGPNVRLLEKRLADLCHTRFCVAFSSKFWALSLSMKALAIEGRTEIIMPSLAHQPLADIAEWVRLKPRFYDVDPATLAVNANQIKPLINENTALILAVLPDASGSEPNALAQIAAQINIPIVFDSMDSACELIETGRVEGLGNTVCFSLHSAELLNGIGGGYLTTDDEKLAVRLSAARGFGFLGVDFVKFPFGLNAKLNEMHACFALASLDDVDAQIARKREHYQIYKSCLQGLKGLKLLNFDELPCAGFESLVAELTEEWPLTETATTELLDAENIWADSQSQRAHRKPQAFLDSTCFNLPNGESVAEQFVTLPCGPNVTHDDIVKISEFLHYVSDNASRIQELLAEQKRR